MEKIRKNLWKFKGNVEENEKKWGKFKEKMGEMFARNLLKDIWQMENNL